MRYTSEFKVGLFTIIGLSLVAATAAILGGNPFSHKKQHFYSILKNASGIAERSQVRTAGVLVGQVTSVKIIPEGVRIDYEVDSDLQLAKGSYLEVKSRGILGDVYIELERGQENALLKSGDKLPYNPDANDMQSLMITLNDVARDIKKVSANLAKVFGTKQGEKSLKNILDNVEVITKDVRDFTNSEREHAKELISSLRNSALKIEGLLNRNDTKVDQIITNLRDFSAELKQIARTENREKIDAIIDNVNDSAASLKRMLAKIERGEGTIGQLVTKDETADEVKRTLKSIQDVVRPISQLKLTLQDRAEYRMGDIGDDLSRVGNEFNVVFSTRPDRYYLLGISNAAYARKVVNYKRTTDANGNTTQIQENTPEDMGNFRYNLQISQRVGFFAARLGLFASSAGFAGDFYAFNDRFVGTLEFSQFDGEPTPSDSNHGNGAFNLKVYANYFITPNVFITAGIDGLILNSKPFPFIGAGLSLSDDDIKGLVGLVGASAAAK